MVGAISVVLETVVLMTMKEEYDRDISSIIKAGVVAMETKMGWVVAKTQFNKT